LNFKPNIAKLENVQNEEFTQQDYNAPLAAELANLPPEAEPPSPNNPPWNAGVAIGVWILSVVAIVVFPVFFILPYMLINRDKMTAEAFQTDNTAILLNLAAILPAHLFTLLVAWMVATRNRQYSLNQTLGFKSGSFRWWHYPLVLGLIFAVAAIVTRFIPEGDNELLKILRSSYTATILVAVFATFTAPLVEEVVYRGILYSALQRSIGAAGAIAVVTICFASVHVLQYWGSPGTILMICFLSLVLTLIRWKTDNLLPCIIMHTIINGLQAILLVAEPYLPKPEPVGIEPAAAAILKLFT
jgi:membrane protease YdiL (CAAX protease family)